MNPNSLAHNSDQTMVGRRLTIMTIMFLSVLLGLVFYTISTIRQEQSNAVLIDMAGRQRMLLQKHIHEVFLTSQGIPSDYAQTRTQIVSTLRALMEGGPVVRDLDKGQSQIISAVPTEEMLFTLREQRKYFDKIMAVADEFLVATPDHPDFSRKLHTLRDLNSTVVGIADDAVQQLSAYSESILGTMLKGEIFVAICVGVFGIVVAGQGVRGSRRLKKQIAERKRVESALRNSELFLDSIVENLPHMIFVKDATDLRFLLFNKAGENLLGYPRQTMIGKTDYDFFPESEADSYTSKDREVLAGKILLDIPEEGIHTKSQGTRYLHTKKIPILDAHGHPQYLLGISEDITERKQIEEFVRKDERKFRAIYEQAPSGIAVLNSLSGQFTQINQKYCDITGYSQVEMLNRTFQELTHPDDLQADLDRMQQLLTGQIANFQMEKRYIRKNGDVIWVNLTCVPLWMEPTDARQHMAMVEDITYRKRAEKALQESEERYRALYENNPSMYFTVGQNAIVLSVNEFGAQQLGYSVAELIGRSVIDLFFEDDRIQVRQRFEDCVQSPLAVFTWEFRKVRKNQSVLWVKEVARSVHNKDGEIVVLIVCEDISERKTTEKALKEWKALTESILGQLPKGFAYRCLNDKTWTIVYVSDGIEEVTGFPVSALLSGKITYDTLMAHGENERVWPIVQDALAKHLPYENEHQIITRDGKKKWILARGRFIFDETGSLLYLDGLNVDITEHKHIEAELRTSEARFRSLVDHVPFCIYEIGLDGRVSSMNRAGQAMIGAEDESHVLGRSYLQLVEGGDLEWLRKHFLQAVQGHPVDFEFKVDSPEKVSVYSKTFIPILESDGKVIKIVGVIDDITERKQAEERLRESEAKRIEALSQSDALKSALLSSVSHELRTPLTAIKSSVSSLIDHASNALEPMQHEFLTGIDREIDYMSQLVNNLLNMSQIEAGTLVPHREWHPLEDLVEGALRRTGLTGETRNIEIHFPEEVPPVFVDAVEMQQVLINLLDNAVKYSFPNSPIGIRVRVGDQQLEVEVSNKGEPIQEQALKRIFERFYRHQSPRQHQVRGTGLGLAICKGIVEAHGGRIWAESIGTDVQMTFTVPLTESMASFTLEGLHKT
ncbi:MAG: PAS domain S-box protein [Nitrospirales bacterium]|nr:PAS domain S-box protein [Nitrospirales bacterium]